MKKEKRNTVINQKEREGGGEKSSNNRLLFRQKIGEKFTKDERYEKKIAFHMWCDWFDSVR